MGSRHCAARRPCSVGFYKLFLARTAGACPAFRDGREARHFGTRASRTTTLCLERFDSPTYVPDVRISSRTLLQRSSATANSLFCRAGTLIPPSSARTFLSFCASPPARSRTSSLTRLRTRLRTLARPSRLRRGCDEGHMPSSLSALDLSRSSLDMQCHWFQSRGEER